MLHLHQVNRILEPEGMRAPRVVIIGAGVAGLAAALELAFLGLDVEVVERAAGPGGKMREVEVGGARLDAGPTVLTMRWVFEEIFAAAGANLADHVPMRQAAIIARHAWSAEERLDLYTDTDKSEDAIGRLAGAAEARGYREFCRCARRIYETLEEPFIRSPRPRLLSLIAGAGLTGLADLWALRPFSTLWGALGEFFADPRLRQLFARYATYCGSSPFLAPATLMLVAHVESQGVWLVEGGMHRLAAALAELAARSGARFRYGSEVSEIVVEAGRAAGVKLARGERLDADAVVVNADAAAIADGLFGSAVAHAVPAVDRRARSLSAVTWSLLANADGFPLLRHNVFFSRDYRAEFSDIVQHQRLPAAPTVYVCAQDREDHDEKAPDHAGRFLCIVNAPPTGDRDPLNQAELEACGERTFSHLERCGLFLHHRPETVLVTDPAAFERLFPATGGALYGRASQGWKASFDRPIARSKLPRLYLAGGSVHPGPGVPMAALSGRLAAASLVSDIALTQPSRRTDTRGGISMP
jgi:1-hydroxycarotenoid 3,4-desaturase